MSPRRREVFLLNRVEGYSFPANREGLGITLSMVEKHAAKAVLFLTEWMDRGGMSIEPQQSPLALAQKRRVDRALHGPHRSAELEAGFRAWLAADPENARQFERVTEVWDAGSAMPVAGVPRVHAGESTTIESWAVAAMILLVFGIAAWGVNDFWLNPSYGTDIGEQRLVRLDDGAAWR